VELYDCEVIKILDKSTNNIRFENCGFNIKRKEINKGFIHYDCLLNDSNRLRIRKSDVFKIVKENKQPFNGDVYRIYCDGGVHNYGNEKKSVSLSALTTIIFKNDKEIFRTTNVYEQFLDNNTVEILALLIGLRHLNDNEDKIALKRSKIIVSSDSQNLQDYIIRPRIIKIVTKKCRCDNESIYYTELMRELLNELNFYLSFLDIYSGWVKGHTQIKISSNREVLLNYTCDKLCREALKNKLHELQLDNYKENAIKKKQKQYRKTVKKQYKQRSENKSNGKIKSK